jgi:general secretion pathway protein C
MRCARIVPETDGHGNVTGIRLLGIRPDTLMGALGFENGDALQTVNGFDMTRPERALEAYSKLRCEPELRVGLTRRGRPVVLEYHIW